MVFYCQRNSYTTEYKTKVLTTEKSPPEDNIGPDCYEVTFEDTIFFPEGGGQPFDTGSVDDIAVLKVLRRKREAVHYMKLPLEVGKEVTQKINWERRFDHMQQHTGQHLITAIVEQKFGYPTTSWNLGEKISNIELNVVKISKHEVDSLEEEVNRTIRSALAIKVKEYQSDDPVLKEAKTRGLPKDVSGPVRIVSIEGIDANMCCGTHLKNLYELQSIKILYVEKGKSNKTLLHFVAGNRVLSYFGECITREKKLNLILHSNPSDHASLIAKCKLDLKQQQKLVEITMRDLAAKEAALFNVTHPHEKFYAHHRKDADAFYLSCLISSINDQGVFKFLTAGADIGEGILVMDGPAQLIASLSTEVCQILEGKGGGKTKFTAKIAKIQNRKKAEEFVRHYVNTA